MSLYTNIEEQFNNGTFENKTSKQIFAFLENTPGYGKDAVEAALSDMEKSGTVICIDGKYTTLSKSGLMRGKLKGNEKGFAFFIPDDKKLNDFFIPNKSLHGAMHADVVFARHVEGSRGSSDEAEVVKIIERGIFKLSGTYYAEKDFGFIRPDEKSYFCDIYVAFKNALNAVSGDKVYAEITVFPEGKNPEGKVLEVLGRQYDLQAEEISIIKNYAYEEIFSSKVLSEVSKISQTVPESEIAGRLDLTNEAIITIDGDDSRDFDDAVYVEKLSNGNYSLGVHIADVTNYVKRGSELDKEALKRATSVYFPDRVIPMLPKELSNGICSLNEGVLRLTLSCIMEINGEGEVVDKKITKSIMKSRHRMTYNVVQKILEGDAVLIEKYSDIKDMIFLMLDLQKVLTAKRNKRGSIDLDVRESHITVNEQGEINVEPRTSDTAYKIIEEFMVIANETVAEYMFYTELPFIYRIHEKPSPEKMDTFLEFIKLLGINVKWTAGTCHPSDFQNILEKLKGDTLFTLVNKVMLRSMQKAKYSPDNVGHFGLSSEYYCHFTSPIRRYPDLAIHGIIKMLLDGKADKIPELYGNFVYDAAAISSERERTADEAERDVDDLYKAKFMRSHIGEEYEGVISGVTGFGVFVELPNTVEGIVKLENLPRGNYNYDEKSFSLNSETLSFKLGEKVKIGVLGVDLQQRRVEFIIIGKDENEKKTGKRRSARK